MEIVYVHQYFATPESNGGVRSYQVAQAMKHAGNDVTMITTNSFLPKVYQNKKGWNTEYIDGIRVIYCAQNYSNNSNILQRLYFFVEYLLGACFQIFKLKFDKAYVTSTPLTVAIIALFIHYIKRKRFIFEVRDLWPEVPIELGYIKNKGVALFFHWLEKKTYTLAESVIFLSVDMQATSVNSLKVVKSKSHVIPNFSDVETFKQDLNNPKSPGDRCRVYYTGTFGVVNNLSYVVELAHISKLQNKGVEFHLVGKGREEEKLRSAAEKHSVIGDTLFFHKPCLKKELPQIHSQAHFMISTVGDYPVLWKNSANKYFDALASGTPIIVNHEGWQAEEIRTKNCGCVLDRDLESSLNRILEIFNNDQLYQEVRANALALGQEYSVEVLTRKIVCLFHK